MAGRRILSKLRNYSATYYALLKHYVSWDPWAALLSGLTVCLIAALYPLSFYLLALAPAAALSGGAEVRLPLGVSLPLELTFAVALSWLAAVAAANFVADRWIIRRNRAWQDALFCDFVDRLPRLARVDRITNLPLPIGRGNLFRLVFQATRAAFLMGRLISVGLKDFVIALVALAVLAVLDFPSLIVVLSISAAFVPLYVVAATGMVESRRDKERNIRNTRAEATALFKQAASRSWQPRTGAVTPDEAGAAYAPIYGLPNRQYAILATLNLIAVLHAVTVAAAVVVWIYQTGRGFTYDEAVYFVVLLLFLRALMAFASMLGRFTRAYGNTALLRAMIAPQPKSVPAAAPDDGSARFLIHAGVSRDMAIAAGDRVYLLMPPVRDALELIALSNALVPLTPHATARGNWLTLIDQGDLKSIKAALQGLASDDEASPDAARAGAGCPPASELVQGAALVFTLRAWEQAASMSVMPQVIADRPVLIALEPHRAPKEWSPGARLIVSDGKDVLAVGDAPALFDRFSDHLVKKETGDDQSAAGADDADDFDT